MAPHPDLCDTGCRRHALTWWVRDTEPEPHPDHDGWQMCGPCTERHGQLLKALGYEMRVDERATMPTVTEATA